MNKALEALKRLFEHCENHIDDGYYEYDIDIEDYELIQSTLERAEKLEQIWEIIKKHDGKISGLKGNFKGKNICIISMNDLTEENFDSIKEMLKHGKIN